MNTSCFGGRLVEKKMRIVGVGLFLLKLGGSGAFSIRNGWEGDAFVEKWVGVGRVFLKIEWKWVVLVKKWVGACRFCQKMGGSGLFFLKNGWEWVRVAGSAIR